MSYPEIKDKRKQRIFERAIESIQSAVHSMGRTGTGGIVDQYGRSYQTYHQIQRRGGWHQGSMKNWRPKQIVSRQQGRQERERIVDRSVDLFQNDGVAAGAVDVMPSTVVGPGLQPFPNFSADDLGLSVDVSKSLKRSIRKVVKKWWPFADAGYRSTFGGMQYQALNQIVVYGECLYLIKMLSDEDRPYSIAMQGLNPMRLKTPDELRNQENVIDGVQIGRFGRPVAYYIKKAETDRKRLTNSIKNFYRMPARSGNRYNVIHCFFSSDPEAVRGYPWFAPAMKMFRDLTDLLDAELVSNIVTAAFSMFVEVQDIEPEYPALAAAKLTETDYGTTGEKQVRYEELIPGAISYLNPGELPHTIKADRPGTTFEPFVKIIEESISHAVNIPYPVLMKKFENMNYASYRSAMLEAWRVFISRRIWFANSFCQTPYRMLLEEAYLRDDIDYNRFYDEYYTITSADWIGPPKGQIEPVKEIMADEKAIDLRVKSRRQTALERGTDIDTVFNDLADENADLANMGIMEETQG